MPRTTIWNRSRLAWATVAWFTAAAAHAADAPELTSRAWSLLHVRCHACHGEKVQEGGLRLDRPPGLASAEQAEALAKALAPGARQHSELLRRVASSDLDERMPPQGPALSADEVALLAAWIEAGAPWPEVSAASRSQTPNKHWAWTPRAAPSVPQPSQSSELSLPSEARNPIDAFIGARLAAEGRGASPAADKLTLLRRAHFDLVGLPPTPDVMAEFLADDGLDAWSKVVDRLLASPLYGQRWGQHWLDLARYSDTAGDNADYPIPEARLYRDYVIASLNADRPYNEFIVEQLAGDLLAAAEPDERYAERIVATGFVALSRRYATAPFELMHLTIEDTLDTTGRVFLGLTLRCARCHDHKFDPITMEDYYGLYGIFASTRYPYAGSEEFQSKRLPRSGFVSLLSPDQTLASQAAYETQVAVLQASLNQRQPEVDAARSDREAKKRLDAELKPQRDALARLVRHGSPPDLPVAYAIWDAAAADQPIQLRGEPAEPGPIVPRRAPRFLAGDAPLSIAETQSIAGSQSGRLELARWIASADNPLTAQVLVNRVWQHHFGQGLVRTPSNFGALGEPPSHPELLAWLARRFVDDGWSIKSLHRLVLDSATWRQASAPDGAFDPLLGYYPRRRLDAEAIRDAMLFAAGSLDLSTARPHPFPDVADWHWTQHQPFKAVYPSAQRSVLLMRQRIQRHPYLALFDAPDANVSTDVRTQATLPQQALFLLNAPWWREQSAAFAERMAGFAEDDPLRVARAIEWAWSRTAAPAEIEAALRYLDRFAFEARQSGLPDDEARREAWGSYCRVLWSSNSFFFVD